LRVSGRSPTVLALHGYGGTPREVELVVGVARELGLAASAPLLTGHGTHARDLGRTRFEDWLASARAALNALPREEPLMLAGLSMGSLLATTLAVEEARRVRGLVLLANAFWLHPVTSTLLDAVTAIGLTRFAFPKVGADIGDPDARRSHLGYGAHPVEAAADLLRAARRTRELLPHVRCPVLVVHGAKDRVCPVANAWRVAQRLGAPEVRVVVLPRSHHIVTRDREREQLFGVLQQFLGQGNG
jgi:carboxylesterase